MPCIITKHYLVHEMKMRAFTLMILWSILLLEPLSANLNIQTPYSSCSKKEEVKSSCSKSKCSKTADNEDENDCEGNRCNPLMSCPTGNFYLYNPADVSIESFIAAKQKMVLINDNRISKHLCECWHPPEII
jgi:hypothetical protein